MTDSDCCVYFKDEHLTVSLEDVKTALAEHGLVVITSEEQTRTERATREAHDTWRNAENTPDMNLFLDASIARALKGLP